MTGEPTGPGWVTPSAAELSPPAIALAPIRDREVQIRASYGQAALEELRVAVCEAKHRDPMAPVTVFVPTAG